MCLQERLENLIDMNFEIRHFVRSRSPQWSLSLRFPHRVIVGKPEGKRPLGRPRRRWEDTIKMDLREMGGGEDWMELVRDRNRWRALVNTVMNLRVP